MVVREEVSAGSAPDFGEAHNESFWNATFKSLSERDFAWFFTGNFAYFMAIQMQFILYGYLAFDLTGSAKALGVVSAAVTLPNLLASPFAGAVADRVHKRFLLAATQTLAVVMSTTLAVLVLVPFLDRRSRQRENCQRVGNHRGQITRSGWLAVLSKTFPDSESW